MHQYFAIYTFFTTQNLDINNLFCKCRSKERTNITTEGHRMKITSINNQRTVLMCVYNKIQCDARVQRAAETVHAMGFHVILLSCNSNSSYTNESFESIVFSSNALGYRLFFRFNYFVFLYCLANRKRIDILYMHDYLMEFMGLILSSLLRKKWICDCHELLLQKKDYHENIRENSFRLLERISIRSAALVIAANRERERIIRYVYKLKNTTYVGNVAPIFIKDYEELKKKDQLLFQGFLSQERDLSSFFSSLRRLPDSFTFKIIGGGPLLESYRKQVAQDPMISSRVIFTGNLSYSQLLKESQECKIGVIVYPLDDRNCYYCSPNKLFEYIQMGIPILASPQPFLKKVVNEYHLGIIINNLSDAKEICDAILKIRTNYSFYRSEMKRFLKDYSSEKESSRMRHAIAKTFPEMCN